MNDRIYNIDEIMKQLSARVDSSQAIEKKKYGRYFSVFEKIRIFHKSNK